jgi:hypothetical protein
MTDHVESDEPGPGRWVLLVLMLLAAAGVGIVSTEPTNATETVIGIFSGVVGWSFWWLIVGALVWLVRLAIRRRRQFGQVMLAPGLLAVMLALAVISIPGFIAINAEQEDERRSAPSASAADTEDELSPEHEAMVDYINGSIQCAEEAAEGRGLQRRFIAALEKGDWTGAASHAERQRENISEFESCFGGLVPTGDLQLDGPAEQIADALGLMSSAWAIYARGTEQQDVDALGVGDKRVLRARRSSRRAAREVEALWHERDSDLLVRYVDLERLVRARERAGLD